jgi:Ca2+-binding EF-hand superfamily protein
MTMALLAKSHGQTSTPTAVDIHLRGNDKPLRIELTIPGFNPETAHAQFLDRWFDYFDRDGDGSLSRAEADRVIPLPSFKGANIRLDFVRADADKNGQLTRAEFKADVKASGFTPVVVVKQSIDPQVQKLCDATFLRFDTDGGGEFRGIDPKRGLELLRQFDQNEDESLSTAEFLVRAPEVLRHDIPDFIRVHPAELEKAADAVLKITLAPATAGKSYRQHLGGALVAVDGRNAFWKGPAHTTKAFLLAQFDNLRGDRPHVTRKQVEADPTAQLILAQFDHADRDGDGQLTEAELRRFLDLLDEGATCQLVVTIVDRGGNLFDVIDADGDGRLDYREMANAPKRIEALGRDARGHLRIPYSMIAEVQRGAAAPSFGPLPLTVAPAAAARAVERVRKGPRWFQAMDHNQDGFVSPLEFVGPPDAFRRLDADGDGLISFDEANRAETK